METQKKEKKKKREKELAREKEKIGLKNVNVSFLRIKKKKIHYTAKSSTNKTKKLMNIHKNRMFFPIRLL